LEADVARLQLFVVQNTHAAMSLDRVPFEGKVHFVDAVPLGARAKLGLGSRRASAEQNAVARLDSSSLSWHLSRFSFRLSLRHFRQSPASQKCHDADAEQLRVRTHRPGRKEVDQENPHA